jgi:uncharacterized protein (TIGR04255 family)
LTLQRYKGAMPTRRPPTLPNFKRPPVSEVVLSIQFASLDQLNGPFIGLFWTSLRSQYPSIAEQGEIQPVFETFGTPAAQSIRFQALLSPPMPRFWLQKEGMPDLLQIQRDRLMHNWRRTADDAVYPRYEKLRDRFEREVLKFSKFLDKEGLGRLEINQCEVSYINMIDSVPSGGDLHSSLDEISPLWAGLTTDRVPGDVENSLVQMRYFLNDENEKIGRIHVLMQPAFLPSDLKPVFRVELTARGRPPGSSIEEAFGLLDLERDAVVRTFAAVTTPEMHKLWGRTDAQR